MNMRLLVLFLGIIMISSTISVSSSEALLPVNLPDQSQAPSHVRVIEGENIIAYARALFTTLDDPSNHEVSTSDPHDGVAKLILTRTDGTFGCTGTLANDRQHVITAAHCVADNNGNYILTSGSATFEGNSESITISLDPLNSKSHPNYDGDFIKGNDIAILKLVTTAPTQIPGIPHATTGSAVGDVVNKSGYGLSGYFSSGTDRSTYPFGTERNGQNTYDAFADTMYVALGLTSGADFISEAIYQFDSDDGSSPHDAFGFFFGISDLGLGNNEVMSAPGDSGGPTILNGELVGVTSYGITLQYTTRETSDCTKQRGSPSLDSSCGEFAGDTRVSHYADFIASVLTPVNDQDPPTISAINVDVSITSATITWTTNEPATSLVDYGTDDTFGSPVSDVSYVTSHSIELTELSSSTNYHFIVTSVDTSNNSASSGDTHFTTTSPPTLTSITVSPDNPSITEGSTQQFTTTGTYSDGTDQVLTDVIWTSSDSNVATIDGNGLALGISVGLVTITANSGGLVDTTSLDVTAASVDPTVSVSSITPNSVQSADSVDVTILGSNFAAGAQISLTGGSGPIKVSNVFVVDDNTITATIITKDGGPPRDRVWDVTVTNLDGSSGTLIDGFTVTVTSSPNGNSKAKLD